MFGTDSILLLLNFPIRWTHSWIESPTHRETRSFKRPLHLLFVSCPYIYVIQCRYQCSVTHTRSTVVFSTPIQVSNNLPNSLALSLAPFLISLEWIYVKWCKAFTVSDVIALVLMIRTEVKLPFHKCSQFIGMTGRCRCLPLSTYLLIEFSHSHKSRMKHNWNAKRCSYIAVAHQLINKRPIYWIQRTSHSMHCYRSHCNN